MSNICNHINADGSSAFRFFNDYNHIICEKCNMVYELSEFDNSIDKPLIDENSSLITYDSLYYRSELFSKVLQYMRIYKYSRYCKIKIRAVMNFKKYCNHESKYFWRKSLIYKSNNGDFICPLCGKNFGKFIYRDQDQEFQLYEVNMQNYKRNFMKKVKKSIANNKLKRLRSIHKLLNRRIYWMADGDGNIHFFDNIL